MLNILDYSSCSWALSQFRLPVTALVHIVRKIKATRKFMSFGYLIKNADTFIITLKLIRLFELYVFTIIGYVSSFS